MKAWEAKMAKRGIFEGLKGAYPRALYRPMGFRDSDFEKPLIGIANSWTDDSPGLKAGGSNDPASSLKLSHRQR